MGQLTKAAAESDKFTKTSTPTEEYRSMKWLHACLAIFANMVHWATTYRILGENDWRELSAFQNKSTGRKRLTRNVNVPEQVLQSIEDNPNTSTRTISQQLGVSQSSVWRALQEECVHPYHLKMVQLLQPDDYPKVWNLHNGSCRKVPWIPFSRFALAYRWSFIYSWRCVHWTQFTCLDYNPHGTRSHASKHWGNTGIIGDYLLGLYLLPYLLDGRKYLIFLEIVLPTFLGTVPAHVCRDMWYQHDGAPSHTKNAACDYLNWTYEVRWIGRRGPISWLASSPDLTPMDFIFWGSNERSCAWDSHRQWN